MSRSAEFPSSRRSGGPPRPRRILFLDDDPVRAEIFLAENPDAVWVETVEGCLERLEEAWDEVHLDHDLGGETFVDCGRDDCGMAIVRWLCLEPRPHLRRTRFVVHSHNPSAASLMVLQIFAAGFQVEGRPFGSLSASFRPGGDLAPAPASARGWRDLLLGIARYLAGPRARRPR